jgi:hypothetical protein
MTKMITLFDVKIRSSFITIGSRYFSSTSFLNVKENLTREEEKLIEEMSQQSYNNSPSFPEPAEPAVHANSAEASVHEFGKIVQAQSEEGKRRAVLIKENCTKEVSELAKKELPDVDPQTVETKVKENMDELFTGKDEYLGGQTVMRNQEESYAKSIEEVDIPYADEGADSRRAGLNSPSPSDSEYSLTNSEAREIALASFEDSMHSNSPSASGQEESSSNSNSPSASGQEESGSNPNSPSASGQEEYGSNPNSPSASGQEESGSNPNNSSEGDTPSNQSVEETNNITMLNDSTQSELNPSHKRNHSDYDFDPNKRQNINDNEDDDNNNRKGPGGSGPSVPSGDGPGSSDQGGDSNNGTSNKTISHGFIINFLYGIHYGDENFLSPIDFILDIEQEELLDMPYLFDGFDLL